MYDFKRFECMFYQETANTEKPIVQLPLDLSRELERSILDKYQLNKEALNSNGLFKQRTNKNETDLWHFKWRISIERCAGNNSSLAQLKELKH